MKLTEHRSRWPRRLPRVAIGVDAGETTGVAIWKRNLPDKIRLYELRAKPLLQLLLPYTKTPQAHFFLERFDIGNETVRVSPPIDSLYLNGWITFEATPIRVTEIGRADAKTTTNNKQLRHLGWWEVGSDDHCRDAARILAFALRRFEEPWLMDKLETYLETLK